MATQAHLILPGWDTVKCTKCGEFKDWDGGKGWHRTYWCPPCNRAYRNEKAKQRYVANPERAKARYDQEHPGAAERRARREYLKAHPEFARALRNAKRRKPALSEAQRLRRNEKAKQRYVANPERAKARYDQEHPGAAERRARREYLKAHPEFARALRNAKRRKPALSEAQRLRRNEKAKQRYVANPEPAKARAKAKYAANPELAKARAKARAKAKRAADPEGYRKKQKEYQRQWDAANPGYQKEYLRQWRAANPGYARQWYYKNHEQARVNGRRGWRNRRARKLNAICEHGPGCYDKAVREITRRRCAIPGCRARKHIQADHIIPLAKGGLDCRDNLQLLCRHHNATKNAQDPIAYARRHGMLF